MVAHAHIFLDGVLVSRIPIDYIPRVGDTVRVDSDKYAKVIEIIWCFDEPPKLGQRVNIRLESEREL